MPALRAAIAQIDSRWLYTETQARLQNGSAVPGPVSALILTAILAGGCSSAASQPDRRHYPNPEFSAADAARLATTYSEIEIDGGDVYWLETAPDGRGVIRVQLADSGRTEVLTPPDSSVYTAINGYGGGAYVVHDGIVFFVNANDQQIYRQESGAKPEKLTNQAGARFAECSVDARRHRLICVRETTATATPPSEHSIVAVDLESGGGVSVLFGASDFVAHPRLSPDGDSLAWIAWDHPNMPWDESRLIRARVADDGGLPELSEFSKENRSSLEPQWSPGGQLFFISEIGDRWGFYRWHDGGPEPAYSGAGEFGKPLWYLDNASYAILSDDKIVASYFEYGDAGLVLVDLAAGTATVIADGLIAHDTNGGYFRFSEGDVYFIAATRSTPHGVYRLSVDTGEITRLAGETGQAVHTAAEPVTFPTAGGQVAHGILHLPKTGESPPLIVNVHRGPTRVRTAAYDPVIEFWRARGFAVLDLNYRGSSGYGREFRRSLYGCWGKADVEDAVSAARYLIDQGIVSADAQFIRGASAGGYTALMALATQDSFDAGASYFGVADPLRLARIMHKYERHYLDSLLGPLPAAEPVYRNRSPVNLADRIGVPVLITQGKDDPVVPYSQASSIVSALEANDVPVTFLAFDGESHGFRKASSIEQSLLAELGLYRRILEQHDERIGE